MTNFRMKDSGDREEFSTGAVRDTAVGKPRPALTSPLARLRLAEVMAKGAGKYGDRNWELGIPLSRFLDSLYRHLLQWELGETDEDHLGQAMFNLAGIIHTEEMVKRGLLPQSLADLPSYVVQPARPNPGNIWRDNLKPQPRDLAGIWRCSSCYSFCSSTKRCTCG